MTSKISVIIPFFNRYHTICRAVESILLLDNIKFVGEIIIIDDGSTNSESLKLNNYISKIKIQDQYQRINFVVFKYDSNVNAAYARNLGITKSKFDVLAFLDSDDEWIDGKLRKQLSYLENNTIVFSQFSKVNSKVRKNTAVLPTEFKTSNIADYLLLGKGHIQTSTILCHKKTAEKVMFNNDLRKYQDWDFAIRAWDLGVHFSLVSQPLTNYYVDSNDRIGSINNKSLVNDFFKSVEGIVSSNTRNHFIQKSTYERLLLSGQFVSALKHAFVSRHDVFLNVNIFRTMAYWTLKVIILKTIKRN
tara:strand:- start:60848 stop:61759 length:912 start_codon:yes stop_codon:yes gene_type:complete